MNEFGDLLGTPYAPVSKIAPVKYVQFFKCDEFASHFYWQSSQFLRLWLSKLCVDTSIGCTESAPLVEIGLRCGVHMPTGAPECKIEFLPKSSQKIPHKKLLTKILPKYILPKNFFQKIPPKKFHQKNSSKKSSSKISKHFKTNSKSPKNYKKLQKKFQKKFQRTPKNLQMISQKIPKILKTSNSLHRT